MGIVYTKLTTSDLEVYIQMRIEQLREEGAKEDIDLAPALMDYYSRHMADGTFYYEKRLLQIILLLQQPHSRHFSYLSRKV